MARVIIESLKREVKKRAENKCEYCGVPEAFMATYFHVDHIRSIKHGGRTILENLALACPHCNQNKGSDIATFKEDASDEIIRFYNPRVDAWSDHFITNQGEILPLSEIGKATIKICNYTAAFGGVGM